MSPRLDSRWAALPLTEAGIAPAESAGLILAHRTSVKVNETRLFVHNPRESRFLAPLCEWPVAAECGTIDSIFDIKALPIWTSAV